MLISPKKAVKLTALVLLCSIIITGLSLLYLNFRSRSENRTETVRFVFFDVGQGDASLIENGSGFCLIDCGPEASEERLCTALSAHGVTEISLLFLTHTDSDHSGGADRILRKFKVSTLYLPAAGSESTDISDIKRAARESGTDIRYVCAGDYFTLGNAEISVLSPFSVPSGDENSDSLILRVSYGTTSALYMGDADTAAEKRLLEQYSASFLLCDILKVGHHGSDTSSSESLLEAAKPRFAVISCGLANSYGHPHPLILHRLRSVGAEILSTDLYGETVLESDGLNVTKK